MCTAYCVTVHIVFGESWGQKLLSANFSPKLHVAVGNGCRSYGAAVETVDTVILVQVLSGNKESTVVKICSRMGVISNGPLKEKAVCSTSKKCFYKRDLLRWTGFTSWKIKSICEFNNTRDPNDLTEGWGFDGFTVHLVTMWRSEHKVCRCSPEKIGPCFQRSHAEIHF